MTRARHLLVVAALALVPVAVTSCGSGRSATGTTTTTAPATSVPAAGPAVPAAPAATLLAPAAFKDQLAGAPGAVLLDVRTPDEFVAGHLAGARVLDLNGGQFAKDAPTLDRNATYFVYCHSGNRSAKATALMRQLGFQHVYELRGGIAAWQAAGLPTTSA